jgi:hypothetical protein
MLFNEMESVFRAATAAQGLKQQRGIRLIGACAIVSFL